EVKRKSDRGSWRVSRENEVALFDGCVAGIALREAGLGGRLTVLVELRVSPAAGRRVFLRVLDHELEVPVGRWAGDGRLLAAEDLVVLLGRDVRPSDPRDDRAFRKRKLSGSIRLDRAVVSKDRADVVEIAGFVGHRDELPVAIAVGNPRDVNPTCSASLGLF